MLSAVALAVLTVTQSASASAADPRVSGLWSATYTAAQTDCGSFSRDASNFCWTAGGDGSLSGPGIELGVKFTSSRNMNITGVRVYRVSPGTMTGHLWDGSGGAPLATGTFSGSDTHSWQDLMFSSPVPIQAGHTYVASYHVSDTQYALQYDFFTTGPYTSGPITALSSPDSGGNGVYCYDNDPTHCAAFPQNTFRDINYWVTPLWGYNFSGFFQPVNNVPTVNVAKAGSAIPVKFSLGGNQGLNIFQAGAPQVVKVSCSSGVQTDLVETTITAGGSSLQYDWFTNQYIYVWKTTSSWAGSCVQFELGLNDGSTHRFFVQFKK
ncbi:MAG TPA: PxKF domain-containing protein [Jatrophihabitans sp.]|nr:PxKF domain-containing protein [Jatrophihabitans sp.]